MKRLALLGYPLGHSMSPKMMNHTFQRMGLPYEYVAHEVEARQLQDTWDNLRFLYRGCNVTIPYKEKIMAYLDDYTPEAREIGAVNTIVFHEGASFGYNTDGVGYLRSLLADADIELKDQQVILLGAGGAARAVGMSLATSGVEKITIANRSLANAENLARQLSLYTEVEVVSLSMCKPAVREARLVVNTTSIGMYPNTQATPIPVDWLHPELWVSDVVYNPIMTALLQGAINRGAKVHTGIGMFVHQAALAIEIWTEKKAPIHHMKSFVEAILKENTCEKNRSNGWDV